MADSNTRTRLAQLKFKAASREPLLNQRAYSITSLPLAVSLKRAVVMAGAEGFIPRLHARRLLALLQLQEV
jgi:hypothetical protein